MSNITTTIKFATTPSTAFVIKPVLKYNKKNWFSFEMDDMGDTIPLALSVLTSKYYTDGCGNNKPYTMSAAVNGANETSGIEYSMSDSIGDTLRAVISAGGDLSDHGYFHDPVGFGADVTPLQSTILMQDFIRRKFDGYEVRSKIVPTNYAGHAQAAFDQGYLYSTSQGTFDSFTPQWMYAPPGNHDSLGTFAAVRRDFSDSWQNDLQYFKSSIDVLNTSVNKFYRIGSHFINNETAFRDFFNYVQTTSNDELLVATTREVLEYREMRELPITQNLIGDTLIITVDTTNLSPKNRWKDMSFIINSDAQIASVTTTGSAVSFNPTNGLVNVFKTGNSEEVELKKRFPFKLKLPPAPPDPDLLDGFTRIVPPTSMYTTTDNKIYKQYSNFEVATFIDVTAIEDFTVLVKFVENLPPSGYGSDLMLCTDTNGSNQVDIYFMDDMYPRTYVDEGIGGDEQGSIIELTRWYGLRKVNGNIKAVWTSDGVNYTTIADFGDRPNHKYLHVWGNNYSGDGSILSNPQYKQESGASITPTPPTSGVVDDTANTFNWTNNPTYTSLSDYEQTLDGGVTVTEASAKPIVVGNVNKAIGQVGVRVKAVTGRTASSWLYNATAFTATETDDDIVVNEILNHRFTAESAKNESGTPATEAQPVQSFTDVIGSRTVTWAGANSFGIGGEPVGKSANVTLSKPKLYNQVGINGKTVKGVFFENEANVLYKSAERDIPNELRTWSFVFVPSDYRVFEAWFNIWQTDYLGNTNFKDSTTPHALTTLRTESGVGLVTGNVIMNAPNLFIYQCVEDGLQSSPDKISVKLYLNGTLLNPSTHLETMRRDNRPNGGSMKQYSEGFGANSNVDMMFFLEFGIRYGSITQQQITDLYNAYNNKYALGIVINAPYATNVKWTKVGNQMSVTYTYVSPSGVAENTNATIIQWIDYGSANSIQTGEMITAVNNLKTFDRATTPGRFVNGRNVRVNVIPVDINGNRMIATRGVNYATVNNSTPNPDPIPDPDPERVTGKIPFDPLYFYQENSAINTVDKTLMSKDPADFNPVNSYGQLYANYRDVYMFPEGMEVVLSSLKLGDGQSTGESTPFIIKGILPDNTETTLYTFTGLLYNTEITHNLPTPLALKGITFSINSGYKPTYVYMYGEYTPVQPVTVSTVKHPFKNQTGINSFVFNHQQGPHPASPYFAESYRILKKMGSVRIYLDAIEVERELGRYRYKSNWRGYDTDDFFTKCKEDNIFVNLCIQGAPAYITQAWNKPEVGEDLYRPVGTPKEAVTSYQWIAKIAFQIAARYGRNTTIPLSLIEVDTNQEWYETPSGKVVGMDVIQLMEISNELDKWWKGTDSNFLGREYAYFASAVYDGHKGSLGAGYGIKTADPTMQVTNAGLASFDPDFLIAFVNECAKIRGYNEDGTVDIPVDGYYSYHCYPNTASQQHSGEDSRGATIENTIIPEQLDIFQKANKIFLGEKLIVSGETGYDLSQNSPLRATPPLGSPYTVKQWAGIMNLRTALYYAKHGVYRNFFFTWADDEPDWETTGDGWQFSSCGFIERNGDSLVLRPSARYLIQVNEILKDHIWQEQISSSPLIDKWKNGTDIIYSVYYPTENNTTGSYNLVISDNVKVYTLNDTLETPTETNMTSTGSISIAVTETPVFYRVTES